MDDRRIDELLAAWRWRGWPDGPPPVDARPRLRPAAPRLLPRPRSLVAAAAGLLALPLLALLWKAVVPGATPQSYAWEAVAGHAWVEAAADDPEAARAVRGVLAAGGRLHVAADSRVRLDVGEAGTLHVDADSVLRVEPPGTWEGDGDARYRFFLERGSLDAFILAAPGAFQVGTPAGPAIDLGCAYRLEVDPDGSTRLMVSLGEVALRTNDGTRLAVCSGWRTSALADGRWIPPLREAAPESWRFEVAKWTLAKDPPLRALGSIADRADVADAYTLWTLAGRVDEAARALLRARVAALVPPPAGTDPQAPDAAQQAAWEAAILAAR